MVEKPKLSDLTEIKIHNIVDMGLTFSAMIRLFQKGSKKKLRKQILAEIGNVFKTESKDQFTTVHSKFCHWGVKNILQAEKKRRGRIIKNVAPASYGQIAKTFDVVLKVAIYYSHLPSCEKSRAISRWLNAAVDRKKMTMLKRSYPKALQPWPTTVEKVGVEDYKKIQQLVRKFIEEKHSGEILPVQFDDKYWYILNRRE